MRRSIATVSMSGTLRQKFEAIAAARFDGYEIFENDLIYFNGSPKEARAIADDLGLTCELYQPFRDFEGMPDEVFRRNLERAERKFDVMQALGAQLMLVCSNTSPQLIADESRAAEQLYALAERAARRHLRIGYEALAWGRVVNLYGQAWSIVRKANHPHLGLILDSFHTLSLRDDPEGIAQIPGEKIFFLQMADAPLLAMDVLQWARHFRNFPGQGQFDVERFFELVLLAGYTGPLSLEIFNDIFRQAPNRRTATDAMRSLLYLEGRVRERLERAVRENGADSVAQARVLDRIELFDPPAPPKLSGIAFIEFAVDDESGAALATLLERFGFHRAGEHRSKPVTLYRQGRINLVLNRDPQAPSRARLTESGPAVSAIGLWTDDPVRAVNRATALQSARAESRVGANEVAIPGIVAPGGIIVYFVDAQLAPHRLFEIDFQASPQASSSTALVDRIDHVAFGMTQDRLDTWILFCRAVLGMSPGDSLELSDPYGLVRSAGIATRDRSVRFVLNVSLSERTRTARTVSAAGGLSVHHIALSSPNIIDSLTALRARGATFVPISGNYYDDLLARLDVEKSRVDRMRDLDILYDAANGEYLHTYSNPFADRFFFEIIERSGDYDAYGAMNAPARMASQEQSDAPTTR